MTRAPPTEWLNRMWRSTSSLLDTKAARSLLDTPTGRTVLNRFVGVADDADWRPATPSPPTARCPNWAASR